MEVWKEIFGYESLYSISNLGRVKSHKRMVNYRIQGLKRIVEERIKPHYINSAGYPVVQLWKNNVGKTIPIHRLLAVAFIPNPENKKTVNHKNGVKSDNRIENLEWCTYQENLKHAVETGLNPTRSGEQLKHSKLNYKHVNEIRQLYDSGVSIKDIHKEYNYVSITSIHSVCYRKTWIKSGLNNG